MKIGIRLLAASLLGVLAGWLGSQWLTSAHRPAVRPIVQQVPAPPPPLAQPSWKAWLNSVATPAPPADAGDFWIKSAALPPSAALGRRSLFLGETLAYLPYDQLKQVLTDERFGQLPEAVYDYDGWGSNKLGIWMQFFKRLSTEQAAALIDEAPYPFLHSRWESVWSKHLALSDPDAGFAFFKPKDRDTNNIARFLASVAEHDPAKATELWHRLPPEDDFSAMLIMETLLRKDWKEAIAWAQQHLPEKHRMDRINWVFNQLEPKHKESLLQAAAEMTDPELRSMAYSKAVTSGHSSKPEDMVREALALPPDSLNDKGWQDLGRVCATRLLHEPDPAASAVQLKALAAQLPEEGRDPFLQMAANMASWNNPPLASELIDHLPASNVRSMIEKWSQSDPTAVSAWLDTLEPSPKRDEAIAGFCGKAALIDPARAAQWALTIQGDGLREGALRETLHIWKQADPAAAAAWTEAQGLDLSPPPDR